MIQLNPTRTRLWPVMMLALACLLMSALRGQADETQADQESDHHLPRKGTDSDFRSGSGKTFLPGRPPGDSGVEGFGTRT